MTTTAEPATNRTRETGRERAARAHRASELQGFAVTVGDERVGTAFDLIFDDEDWTVRYLVVDTRCGTWGSGRKAILEREQFGKPDTCNRSIPLRITPHEFECAPPVDKDPPLSREVEVILQENYGWRTFLRFRPSPYAGFLGRSLAPECDPEPDRRPIARRERFLRSMREVVGYDATAADQPVGYLQDFLIEDGSWKILYCVVDTHRWLPSRRVLVLPVWVQGFDWSHQEMKICLDRERVQNCESSDSAHRIQPGYVLKLQEIFRPFGDHLKSRSENMAERFTLERHS